MTKNYKTVSIVIIAAVVIIIAIIEIKDYLKFKGEVRQCPDGPHYTIDIRDFTDRYWTYYVKLEARIKDINAISIELDPKLLMQISEDLQKARELQKLVVVGYNACTITKDQYSKLVTKIEQGDSLAREIDALLSRSVLSANERSKLNALIEQYGNNLQQ